MVLVLSVSVETLLEPFSFIKGLQKKANPDDVLKSVEGWLPEGSGEAAKIVAIQSYAENAKLNMVDLEKTAKEISGKAMHALSDLRLETQVSASEKEIAVKFSTLREKYDASQKQRITILCTLSAAIGIFIAYALQINSFGMLGSLFSAETMQSLSTPLGQFGGIILIGLAASAGSSFRHDMLGRVRNIKDTVKQVEVAVSSEK